MDKAIALIEEVIKEHEGVLDTVHRLDQMMSDAEALSAIDEARSTFIPGRFNQKDELTSLEGLIDLLDEALGKHFEREETAVLGAFMEHGDRELIPSFRSLMQEHTELKNRLATTRDYLSRLSGGDLPVHHWQATAYDLRAHIAHIRKLLQAHAEAEEGLLLTLRGRLTDDAPPQTSESKVTGGQGEWSEST